MDMHHKGRAFLPLAMTANRRTLRCTRKVHKRSSSRRKRWLKATFWSYLSTGKFDRQREDDACRTSVASLRFDNPWTAVGRRHAFSLGDFHRIRSDLDARGWLMERLSKPQRATRHRRRTGRSPRCEYVAYRLVMSIVC
jgi:hypothetical protein